MFGGGRQLNLPAARLNLNSSERRAHFGALSIVLHDVKSEAGEGTWPAITFP